MSGGITVCIREKMWVGWFFFYDFPFCPEDGAIYGDITGPIWFEGVTIFTKLINIIQLLLLI